MTCATDSDPREDFEDDGWDSDAVLIDGRWVDRTPKRLERVPMMRCETRLMPWLSPQLPLAVSVPWVIAKDPFKVRHELIPGSPCPGIDPRHGEAIGPFLSALHRVDPVGAVALGVPDAQTIHDEQQTTHDRFRLEVISRLPSDAWAAAQALLERASLPPTRTCLTHSDLGPDHIRVIGHTVTGVIDWADACINDPAIDLAWVLNGTSAGFAHSVVKAYGVDEELARRAHNLYQIGPWHEVIYGLDAHQPEVVDTGIAGVLRRLRGGA